MGNVGHTTGQAKEGLLGACYHALVHARQCQLAFVETVPDQSQRRCPKCSNHAQNIKSVSEQWQHFMSHVKRFWRMADKKNRGEIDFEQFLTFCRTKCSHLPQTKRTWRLYMKSAVQRKSLRAVSRRSLPVCWAVLHLGHGRLQLKPLLRAPEESYRKLLPILKSLVTVLHH
eukprot:4768629-Amphidinium_carterae.2